MSINTQFVVIREAVEVVLRHLECLPPSDAREQLRSRIQDCAQDAEMWSASWPTPREMDVLMKRVLALHVEVTKVERAAAGPKGGAVTA
ncbi:MAG: hypothetical protein ACLP1X_34110 [Polyangiaceae bacterium]